jgi:hypothetical protein
MTTHRDLTTPEEVLAAVAAGERVEANAGREWRSTEVLDSWPLRDIERVMRAGWRYRAVVRPRTFTAAEVAEALRGWGDAYAAFVGAFDTPAARRRQSDEYANDARDRLREFNERITHWLRENEG